MPSRPAIVGTMLAGSIMAFQACGRDMAQSSSSVPPNDWPVYNRSLAGDRYSPLDEINRAISRQRREP